MTIYVYDTFAYPGVTMSGASDINDAEEIVGDYLTGSNTHGFVFEYGTFFPLNVPNASSSVANAVNNAGEIVGSYSDSNGTHGYAYFTNGTYATINYPTASGSSSANDVNNAGEIVGTYKGVDHLLHGFVDIGGTYTALDVPGSISTNVISINDSREIVGSYTDTNHKMHGFFDIGGTFTTIDVPGAQRIFLNKVNNAGEIVGETESESFVYDNGTFTQINYPGNVIFTHAGGLNDAGQIVGTLDTSTGQLGFIATPVCFAQGTRIATTRGGVAVEQLMVGDLAVTASGATRPIRWLGHRTIDCRHPRAAEAKPVRIAANALGEGLPARELLLSPGHPVLVDAALDGQGGYLVPIMCLVNGTTLCRISVETVTYWHVELDAHDILLAENLPAESYLDWGDRAFFTEGCDHALANPDFVVPGLAGRCRPVAVDGPVVEAERRRLDAVFATRLSDACGWPDAAHETAVF